MRKIQAPLFILSHMRSYSSLLAHVLGSHPDVDGYCETHLRYYFRFDVLRLHWRVRKLTGEPLRGRYVLDKILHNYAISPGILEDPRTRAVLLLREPVDVVQSILHMGQHLDPLERNTNLEHVGGYYLARLQALGGLARQLGRRAAFLESKALLERTDDALEFLRHHLELNGPLQRQYRSFAKTGKPGFGDPSPAIRSGEIGGYRAKRAPFALPQELVEKLTAAYLACREACLAHCVSMSESTGYAAYGLSERAPQPSVA
ncbi:MAG TPA: hypothetical protein VFS52_12515 [Steroidobacteraceae bacterium]|jgi:hypothetical protein|nr:hypothetical protein [Steroidobacteraceae bacterium]